MSSSSTSAAATRKEKEKKHKRIQEDEEDPENELGPDSADEDAPDCEDLKADEPRSEDEAPTKEDLRFIANDNHESGDEIDHAVLNADSDPDDEDYEANAGDVSDDGDAEGEADEVDDDAGADGEEDDDDDKVLSKVRKLAGRKGRGFNKPLKTPVVTKRKRKDDSDEEDEDDEAPKKKKKKEDEQSKKKKKKKEDEEDEAPKKKKKKKKEEEEEEDDEDEVSKDKNKKKKKDDDEDEPPKKKKKKKIKEEDDDDDEPPKKKKKKDEEEDEPPKKKKDDKDNDSKKREPIRVKKYSDIGFPATGIRKINKANYRVLSCEFKHYAELKEPFDMKSVHPVCTSHLVRVGKAPEGVNAPLHRTGFFFKDNHYREIGVKQAEHMMDTAEPDKAKQDELIKYALRNNNIKQAKGMDGKDVAVCIIPVKLYEVLDEAQKKKLTEVKKSPAKAKPTPPTKEPKQEEKKSKPAPPTKEQDEKKSNKPAPTKPLKLEQVPEPRRTKTIPFPPVSASASVAPTPISVTRNGDTVATTVTYTIRKDAPTPAANLDAISHLLETNIDLFKVGVPTNPAFASFVGLYSASIFGACESKTHLDDYLTQREQLMLYYCWLLWTTKGRESIDKKQVTATVLNESKEDPRPNKVESNSPAPTTTPAPPLPPPPPPSMSLPPPPPPPPQPPSTPPRTSLAMMATSRLTPLGESLSDLL